MNTFSPVAIIAAECNLPGGKNIDAFWSMIRRGHIAIDHAPESRFNRNLYFDPIPGTINKTYTDLAALIDYSTIDRTPAYWPNNFENLYDIAHIACADTVARTCLSIGIDPAQFPVRNTGIFIGHTRPGTIYQDWNYQTCIPEAIHTLDRIPEFKLPAEKRDDFYRGLYEYSAKGLRPLPIGPTPVMLSSDLTMLIQSMLHINGPGMVFNSACASSLHSIMQAALALDNHRIDFAIAGGSSFFHTDTLVLFAGSRSMTTNRSCPFDAEADGMVVGEGNVIFFMKRLEDALAANDPILGVLTGVGVASDGKGKSLWAPRKEGQVEAVRRAYSDAVPSSEVDYIEAHATSTALGDATELEALGEVFSVTSGDRSILLGSAKGNVGHTLEVAGATGVLKALLALKNGMAPPVGGLKNRNPKIPWSSIPFVAPMTETPIPEHASRPRRAAVNSFGIGGLNVHLVLDEFVPDYWKRKITGNKTYAVAVAPKQEEIAVVGYGCIVPDAYSVDALWELLAGNKTAFRPVPNKMWNLELFAREFMKPRVGLEPRFLAAVIDHYQYDWKKNKIPPKQVENASPIQFMMLDAVNEAVSGLDLSSPEARRRVGVLVGSPFGGDFSSQINVVICLPAFRIRLEKYLIDYGFEKDLARTITDEYVKFLHKKMPALLDETGSFTPSALASRITKTLNLMGGAVAVESETGSFGAALLCAVDQLTLGLNDTMIVIGGQEDMSPPIFRRLYEEAQLSSTPDVSPLDKNADGYLPGEGCGVLVLKRLADAKRDGNIIHAVLAGIGAAAGPSLYANTVHAARRSDNSERPASPDLFELPLLGLPDHDSDLIDAVVQLRSMNATKDDSCPKSSLPVRVGCVENKIGFFSAGSAAAVCIKAVLEMEKQQWLPLSGLTETAACFARYADQFDFSPQGKSVPVHEACIVTGNTNTYVVRFVTPNTNNK